MSRPRGQFMSEGWGARRGVDAETWGCEDDLSDNYVTMRRSEPAPVIGRPDNPRVNRNVPRECYLVVTPKRNRSITNKVKTISFIALLHPN